MGFLTFEAVLTSNARTGTVIPHHPSALRNLAGLSAIQKVPNGNRYP